MLKTPENLGKIPKHLGKNSENLGKNGAQRRLTSKMAPNVCRKINESLFWRSHQKGFLYLCGRKWVGKRRRTTLRASLGKFGQTASAAQKFACSYTYGFVTEPCQAAWAVGQDCWIPTLFVPKLLLVTVLKQLQVVAFALRKMYRLLRHTLVINFIFTVPQYFFSCDSPKLFSIAIYN